MRCGGMRWRSRCSRGAIVSHKPARNMGSTRPPRRRPQAGDKRHLGEVLIKINRVRQYLWSAVDQAGYLLAILVEARSDA